MIKVLYIPIDPLTLHCPRCGSKPGRACDTLKGEIELMHVERVKAAAAKDVAAKKALHKK